MRTESKEGGGGQATDDISGVKKGLTACFEFGPRHIDGSGLKFGARIVVPARFSVTEQYARQPLLVAKRIPVLVDRSWLLFFTGIVIPGALAKS